MGHIASCVKLVIAQLDLVFAVALCRLLVEVERGVRGEVSMEELPGRSWATGEEGVGVPLGENSRQEAREALDSITGQKTSCSLM